MSAKEVIANAGGFFRHKPIVFLVILLLLGIAALADYLFIGNNRYTMVFYSIQDEIPVIEDRMIPAAKTEEESLTRYVDEVLLGSVKLDIAPLFPQGTRLESLFCRDNAVFINLSREAAFPPPDSARDVKENLSTLVSGIRRNFANTNNINIFINGNEVFIEENVDKS